MNIKRHMPKRSIRTATALALTAVVAVSLLLAGADSASASPIIIIVDPFTEQCSNGVAVYDPANKPDLVADCAILLAAKDTLEGTSGNLNWSADVGIGEWDGVVIASNRVSELLLGYDYNLNGEIPAELGNLANLEFLYLPSNSLTGAIPPELGNLTKLENLHLIDNRLTGAIPPELGNLANLGKLLLYANQLTGILTLQCYYESCQIWMSAERDNLGIEAPFSGG